MKTRIFYVSQMGLATEMHAKKKKKDNKCNLFLAIKFPLALRNLK